MRALPLNTTISNRLRRQFSLALGFLPVGLAFAAFVPLWPFSGWLEATLGIPHNAPIRDQPNGFLWLVLFLIVTVGLMLFGYALGWLLNALFCLVTLRWPLEKVRRVFLESDVPQEWLKERDATANSIKTADELAELRYSQLRKSFVLRWLRTSGLALLLALAMLAFIWLRAGIAPIWLIGLFAGVPFVFSATLFAVELFLTRFERDQWRWDDSGITIRGWRYRWTSFQRFRVDHESLPAGFASFSIQFRDRFMGRGIWLGISSHTSQVETLAEAARQHISNVP